MVTPSSPPVRSSVLRDLVLVASLVVVYFGLATWLELFEKVTRFAQGYESWQLDELPLTLLVLSVGLAWFAARRVQEARRELRERIQAQARVAELLAHNRDLAQQMILVQENERRALARELHDEVGQHCTAMRAEASFIAHATTSDSTQLSAKRIGASAEMLYGLVKGMLNRLRPPALDSLGIESALEELCETWELQSGIPCGFVPRDVPDALADATAVALYRLVQEALTNVARHAHASHAHIRLHGLPDGAIRLSIEDDGVGLPKRSHRTQGFGLIGMQERVAALHGRIKLQSQPGQGLHIHIELPMEACQT
jgi:glucose-6-phosphate-specific signal transduction histidine kinase